MGKPSRVTAAQTELGQRVRARRLELGLSQMGLGERVGLHFTFVSAVERGKRNMSLESLLLLAYGLNVDLGDLTRGLHR